MSIKFRSSMVILGFVALITCLLYMIGIILTDGGNAILVEDGFLVTRFLIGGILLLFSFIYLHRQGHSSRMGAAVHVMIGVILICWFVLYNLQLNHQRQQVLSVFQEFRQARFDKDYEAAYELMTPGWRERNTPQDIRQGSAVFLNLGIEDYSIYNVIFSNRDEAIVVRHVGTSWWLRPSFGDSWNFERVNSDWYISSGESIRYYGHPFIF